jgi:hypothetical protein
MNLLFFCIVLNSCGIKSECVCEDEILIDGRTVTIKDGLIKTQKVTARYCNTHQLLQALYFESILNCSPMKLKEIEARFLYLKKE